MVDFGRSIGGVEIEGEQFHEPIINAVGLDKNNALNQLRYTANILHFAQLIACDQTLPKIASDAVALALNQIIIGDYKPNYYDFKDTGEHIEFMAKLNYLQDASITCIIKLSKVELEKLRHDPTMSSISSCIDEVSVTDYANLNVRIPETCETEIFN